MTDSASASTLLNIPVELQHAIFLRLSPLDVISIGSTCTILSNSINDHALWVQLLRQASLQNRTLISDSGEYVSIRDLRHAATRAARMLRRLQRNPVQGNTNQSILDSVALDDNETALTTPGLEPVKTTKFDSQCGLRISRQTSCLFLIPGGRFLVTGVGNCLSVWDLDAPTPTILSCTTCTPGFIFLVTPSKDQKSFTLAVSTNISGDTPTSKLTVYTYSPSRSSTLELARTQAVQLEAVMDYHISVFTLVDGLFVYLHKGDVHLWDHIHNRFSSWSIPAPFYAQEYPEIVVSEAKQIVIIGERYVLAWDIPRLVNEKAYKSRTGSTLLGIRDPSLSTCLDLPTMLSNFQGLSSTDPIVLPVFCETTHDWYNAFWSPQSFDIIWTTRDGHYDYFTTIEFKNPKRENAPCTAGLGSTFKLLSLGSPVNDDPMDRVLDSWRVCDTSFVKGCYRGEKGIFDVVVTSQDGEHEPFLTRLGVFETALSRPADFDRFWFSFDPASGRACYFSESDQKIVLVEYRDFSTNSLVKAGCLYVDYSTNTHMKIRLTVPTHGWSAVVSSIWWRPNNAQHDDDPQNSSHKLEQNSYLIDILVLGACISIETSLMEKTAHQKMDLENLNDPPTSLINLPTELQHNIFLFIHPLDVISIGSTCRTLFLSTNDRTLWIQLRRQVDIANRAFICEGHDDIPLRQLKHAATGPARMLKRLQDAESRNEHPEVGEGEALQTSPGHNTLHKGISPVKTTMFKPKSRTRIRKDTSCLYLIPGGRLLVTSVGKRLCIWDLEIDDVPTLLASKRCSPEFIFLVTPSKDQISFNIAASMNDEDFEITKLQILTYSSSKPNILQTTETQMEVRRDYDISVFTLTHNLFVYLHLGSIHIWNYVDNTFSSWRVPAPYDSQEFPEMFVHEERQIVIIGERYVVGWTIPPLIGQKEYLSKRGTTLLGTIEPSFSIDLTTIFIGQAAMGVDTPIIPAFVEKLHDWYTVFSAPQLFDIVWTTGDRKYDYFTTISLEESGDPNSPFIVKLGSTIKVLSLADPLSTELDGDRCLDAWRVCESQLVKGHHRRGGRLFDVILSLSDGYGRPSITRLGSFALGEDLSNGEHFDRFRFSFDPVSGRVCYMSRSHQRVVVMDYIGMNPCPAYDSDDHWELLESRLGFISLTDDVSD